jgi:type I restriction enzyme, S subunit
MENNIIPQIRFPEFVDNWGSDKLGAIATFSKGKGISKSEIDKDGTTECVRYGELYTVYSEVITEIVSKTNIDANELVLSEEDDVIIPASGETQIDIATASCVAKSGVALGGDLNIIKSEIDGIFLSYYLNNARKKNIARLAQGISVVHLYASQLASLTVNTPTLPEQTKIATFLTKVDKRINLLQKKKAELEQYKKGVMQKLFSQSIRFKDENGNDFPDWEEKKLGEVCEITKGKQLNKSELEESGTYPTINGGIEPSGYTEDWNTIENTITISEGGNSCGYVNFIKTKYWSGGHCYSLLNLEDETLKEYLYQSLKFNQNQIMRLRVGSGLPNIQKRDINNFIFLQPKKEEQQKIANFLLSLDKSVEKLGNQIDDSVVFKQGLLQKMFV